MGETLAKIHCGDLDILLDCLAFEVVPVNPLLDQWVKNGLPFIHLENTTR